MQRGKHNLFCGITSACTLVFCCDKQFVALRMQALHAFALFHLIMAQLWLQGFALLDKRASPADVLWAGDMNWNIEDGNPPLPAGW